MIGLNAAPKGRTCVRESLKSGEFPFWEHGPSTPQHHCYSNLLFAILQPDYYPSPLNQAPFTCKFISRSIVFQNLCKGDRNLSKFAHPDLNLRMPLFSCPDRFIFVWYAIYFFASVIITTSIRKFLARLVYFGNIHS